ncbi:MAG TPA: inorganic phosphate transporter [Blastocatellia bacterium]|jgi:PiT family inorganic phosphate transporter|nr:inorganic phosphate transporter [Blastocatellia bacterium]
MTALMAFVLLIIVVALVFDYVNGWHDAANSIATVVSTRVLSPGLAVIWAAFFNFAAFLVFGTHVAKTIAADLINIKIIAEQWQLWVLLCGLLGAIIWDVITWYYGLPSSSSHALVGGYAGAAIAAHRGVAGLLKPEGWIKTGSFIFISPLVGMVLGFAIMVAIMWIFRRYSPDKVDKIFRKGQLFSAALYSLGHGGNDAQKTMGIIAGVLVASNLDTNATNQIPLWVVLTCHAAIALGTLSGGWRIVRTMGSRLTKLKPVGGFAAETAGAAAIYMATYGGIPVSTTHTITGAIVGVGATRRLSAVRWGVASRVVWAWVLTIPMSALIAALTFWLVELLHRF